MENVRQTNTLVLNDKKKNSNFSSTLNGQEILQQICE